MLNVEIVDEEGENAEDDGGGKQLGHSEQVEGEGRVDGGLLGDSGAGHDCGFWGEGVEGQSW